MQLHLTPRDLLKALGIYVGMLLVLFAVAGLISYALVKLTR